MLTSMLSEGFFKTSKSIDEVIKRLSQKGFTIKGNKIGMVGRMLTQMCQNPSTGLEREEIPETERKGRDKWRYKKVR